MKSWKEGMGDMGGRRMKTWVYVGYHVSRLNTRASEMSTNTASENIIQKNETIRGKVYLLGKGTKKNQTKPKELGKIFLQRFSFGCAPSRVGSTGRRKEEGTKRKINTTHALNEMTENEL